MELTIELASRPIAWRFAGSTRIQAILGCTPWEDEITVLLARADPTTGAPRVLGALAQAVRGHDAAGALNIILEPQASCELRELLVQIANISPEVSGRRQLEALAGALRRPTAWILWVEGDGSGLERDLLELLDGVRKVAPNRAAMPLVIIVQSRGHRGRFDLSIGLPSEPPLGSDPSSQALWSIYAHWRLAWLAGGRPGLAEQLDALVWPGLPARDDIELEQRLSDAARDLWQQTEATIKESFTSWLGEWPSGSAHLGDQLADHGLLWAPAHDPDRGLQPTPWAARAVLYEQPNHRQRSLLRACDICEPLSVTALSRCLRLEASLKALVDRRTGHLGDLRFAPDAPVRRQAELYDQLQLVPETNPSRASGLIDFADLGSVNHLLADGTTRQLGRDLAEVRNALAHGHPPSWGIVQAVATLWRRLPH